MSHLTSLNDAELGTMILETAEAAGRKDLADSLGRAAAESLPGWLAEFDPSRKKDLSGFVRLRLGDSLILLALREGRQEAATVACRLHRGSIRKIAWTLTRKHGLTSADADDLEAQGGTVVGSLMESFSPELNPSFNGYAFGALQGRPSLVFIGIQNALFGLLGVRGNEYRNADRCRRALDAFVLEHGREPAEDELAERLGLKRLRTVREHLTLKAACFAGLLQPAAPQGQGKTDTPDPEDLGMYGEFGAYYSDERRANLFEMARSALACLARISPKQAVALAHASGFGLTDHAKTMLARMGDEARRQNLCRARTAFRHLFMAEAA